MARPDNFELIRATDSKSQLPSFRFMMQNYQTERRYPSLGEKSDADARSPWQPSGSQLV
jgi:hypothetical protein